MTERTKNPATRLPEPVSIQAVLDALPVGADDAALAAGLTHYGTTPAPMFFAHE